MEANNQTSNTTSQTPQNHVQILSSSDEMHISKKLTDSDVMLPISVWTRKGGYQSDVEVVYWALEAQKQVSLKSAEESTGPGDDDFEKGFNEVGRIQDIQNTLFGFVCDLTSALSKQANGIDHE